MKQDLYSLYRLIESRKSIGGQKYLNNTDKVKFVLFGFGYIFFLALFFVQLYLLFTDSIHIGVCLLTCALAAFCFYTWGKSIGKVFMKVDFCVCKEIEKELYGEDKEEC